RGINVQRQRVILIGDAACLVDPFIEEGIYYAIKSARIASQALLDSHLSPDSGQVYEQRLHEVTAELQTALKIARMLYCFPLYGYHLFKTHPELVECYFRVLCGDHNLVQFYRELRRTALTNLLRSSRWLRDVQYRIPVIMGHKLSMLQR
ncbi:MAG: hypothetical protein OEU26_35835, partial [Candidatus Tectomicrobia bacterium]|nr:hypothetical protein [Candidatus Tectomicrobia bacterium]